MIAGRKRKLTGIGLIVTGALFLFVTNGILIGWRHIWPLFPVAAGVLMLRSYGLRGSANHLFAGLVSVILGSFLLLFSVEILEWTTMGRVWPTIPVVVGGSMLASQMVRHERGSVMLDVGILLFGLLAFLFTTERISPRVAAPFVRFWPLVLVIAGIVILKMHTSGPAAVPDDGTHDPDMDSVRAVIEAADAVADKAPAPTSPYAPARDSGSDRSPV